MLKKRGIVEVKQVDDNSINLEAFFKKKTVVSFFLSFLVLMIHIHSFDSYMYTGVMGGALSYLGRFLTSQITPAAVRLFYLLSAVLFYRDYTYERTVQKYRSRFKSLVIPYLLWCTLYTVAWMLIGETSFGQVAAIETEFSVNNVLCGVFLNMYYKSFWFIFNLIIFTLCCPMIYTMMKNKVIGAAVLIAITVLYGLGITIPEMITIHGTEYVAFWRADSIIFYMIGAFIGIHGFNRFTAKKSKLIALCGLLGFCACSVIAPYFERNTIEYIVFLVVFCFSIWFMFDLINYDTLQIRVSSFSFMMFAMNFYLGVYVAKMLYLILPKSQIWCLVNLVLTLTIELVVILGTSHILNQKCHRLYSLLTGGR